MKTPKAAAVSSSEDQNLIAEYAKSSRSNCKGCGDKIEKVLCLGTIFTKGKRGHQGQIDHHWKIGYQGENWYQGEIGHQGESYHQGEIDHQGKIDH